MRIPVVTPLWLEESALKGRLLSEQEYLLGPLHELAIVLSGVQFDTEARRAHCPFKPAGP